jgi:glycerate kinase
MKVLVAPCSYKGSLSAARAAQLIGRGLKKADPGYKTIILPLTDGGAGFANLITRALKGRMIKMKVTGPRGRPVRAHYGIVREPGRPDMTAVIEMAQAAGLSLIPERMRDPFQTTTAGVGELIKDALRRGCGKVIVGVGDSGTVDCGMAALAKLGVKFLDLKNRPVRLTAAGLKDLKRIDRSGLDDQARNVVWVVAYDVENRLTGERGARMYAPQKGATAAMVKKIDRGLRNFKKIVLNQFDLNLDALPGSGAAGGMGAGLAAVLSARLIPGFDLFRKIYNLDQKINECDYVITGEGRFDEQSSYGKATHRMIALAGEYNKPVVCIAGSVTRDKKVKRSRSRRYVVTLREPGMSTKESMAQAARRLLHKAMIVGKTFPKVLNIARK